MSETIIFLTKNDFLKLSDFIIQTFDATFIPYINYEKPEAKELKGIEDIKKHLSEYSFKKVPALHYLIISPLWTIEPIYFDFIENKSVGDHYSAIQRYGGPSIDIFPCMYELSTSFKEKIVSSMIGDYPYYISGSFLKDKTNGYRTIDRPDSLKSAMSDIRKFIKRNGNRVAYKNSITRVGYAMSEASGLYDQGIKLMQGDMNFKKD